MRKLLMTILSVWFLATFATTPALSDPEFPEGPSTPPAEVPSSQEPSDEPSDEPPDPPQESSDKRTEEDQETTLPDPDWSQVDHTPVVQEDQEPSNEPPDPPQESSDKRTEEDQETTLPDPDWSQVDRTPVVQESQETSNPDPQSPVPSCDYDDDDVIPPCNDKDPPECPNGEQPEDGKCPEDPPECPNEEQPEDGKCPEDPPECPNEEQPEDGKCPEDPPECPNGEQPEDGECPDDPPECPNGEQPEGGECPKLPRSNAGGGDPGSGNGGGKSPSPVAADPVTQQLIQALTGADTDPDVADSSALGLGLVSNFLGKGPSYFIGNVVAQQLVSIFTDPNVSSLPLNLLAQQLAGPTVGSLPFNLLAQQLAGADTATPNGGSPSPLKSGTGSLLAILGLAGFGALIGSRWVRGIRSRLTVVEGESTSDGFAKRATGAAADATEDFVEARAATKAASGADGSSVAVSGEGKGVSSNTAPVPETTDTQPPDSPSSSLPIVGWVPSNKRIPLLLADHHQGVRDNLREVLESQLDFEVVGEASTGTEAVELTERLHPRVVLMDLHIPEREGPTAIARIKSMHPEVNVLVLTTSDSDPDILPAIEKGATYYLLKDTPREELFRAIRAAA